PLYASHIPSHLHTFSFHSTAPTQIHTLSLHDALPISLQHRGQESAGVVSIDQGGNARAVRSMGTLSDAFASDLSKLNGVSAIGRSEEHTSELQSLRHLVCRLLLEKKKKNK